MGTSMQTMDVKEFDVILKGPELSNYQIIDVREKSELQTASIANQGIINLPLSEKSRWSKEILSGSLLDSTKSTLCMCHHGGRSAQMAAFLSKNFTPPYLIN